MTSSKRAALVALIVFFLAITSREIFRQLPPTNSGPAWKLGWVLLCFCGLGIAHRMGPRAAVAELGLTGSAVRGLGMALLASLPMLVALLLLAPNSPRFELATMLSSVLVAAFAEELLFRGYLFRQLYRRAGWGFVSTVLTTALLFGLAHIGTALRGGAKDVLGVVGITALGGAFFAWLFVRWNDNLWVPIGLHLFMNAWWELFAVSANAIGTWVANGARALAIAAAIAITLRFTPRLAKGAAAP